METVSEEMLQEITRRLVEEFHPEKVILFGSHAWGEPNEDSDLDLFIIVSQSEERHVARAVRAYRCLRGVRASMDILVRTQAEVDRYKDVYASLECQVLELGRRLYG